MLNFKAQQEQVSFEKVIVMGVVPFKDKIEGKEVDVCNVFIASPFDNSRGALGFGVAKVKFGTSMNVHRFSGVELPATVEVAFKNTTSGSGKPQRIIHDIRLIPLAKKE